MLSDGDQVTTEQRAILRAAHPDHGGSHEAFVRAMASLRDSAPALSALERELLDILTARSPWFVAELVPEIGVPADRDYTVRQALSRLCRKHLAHARRIRIRNPLETYCLSVSRQTHATAWFAGPAPALLGERTSS